MAKSCCEGKASELEILRDRQRGVLQIVLVLNALMFFAEFGFGLISKSSALLADSLDMFGDAAVYGFSLYALSRGALWRARAGMAKGLIMAVFGLFVLIQTVYRAVGGVVPAAETMGWIGVLALTVNVACLVMLYRHRQDDINMRSTWLCSRNDIIANLGVLTASVLVAYFNSGVPDLVVGTIIAFIFLKSAFQVITEARHEIDISTQEAVAKV